MSRILSVRKTDAVETALSEILRLSTAETASAAVAQALSLYAAWLHQAPGTTVVVSSHTRRTPSYAVPARRHTPPRQGVYTPPAEVPADRV